MTTPQTVIKTLKMLKSSALDYAPRDGIDDLIDTWVGVFADVPDDLFTQAVKDYLRTESRWPAPARIIALAQKVRSNNGQSTTAAKFAPGSVSGREVPGVCIVSDGEWMPWTPGSYKPLGEGYYAERQAVIEEFDRKFPNADVSKPTPEEAVYWKRLHEMHVAAVEAARG